VLWFDAVCLFIPFFFFWVQLVEEAKLLEGPYKRAFEKVGSVMEDSGWLLAPRVGGGERRNGECKWTTTVLYCTVLYCTVDGQYSRWLVQ